ncbi:MAG: soluble lytic murein transglycosylase-like protein [Arenicella sp.]|jgi:soluble lytic murein transglycosylase-like protein
MLIRNLIIATIALLGFSINGPAVATIYVYEEPNGSTVITDSRIKKPGYKLKKSYSSKSYRSKTRSAPYRARTIKSKYDAEIVNAALKYDLEPSFIKAVIHVESAFDRYALSHAGAMGLMQLMPATASSYQLKQDHFNPRRNIDAGVQHIKDLMERYNSDKRLSLAAYNAGQGAVSKYNGVPPYEETQNYIIKVMRLYQLYKKEI